MEQEVVSIQGDSPGEGGVSSHERRNSPIALALAAVLLLAVGVCALYARGGGPVPQGLAFLSPAGSSPLGASSPDEQALRALRLAGIERGVVGEHGSVAFARVEVPAITSAADIEVAWQTAAAALSQSHPGTQTYAVQLFGPGATPLLQVSLPGRATRTAVAANDAAALRGTATVRYLSKGASSSIAEPSALPASVPATATPSLLDYILVGITGRRPSARVQVAAEQAQAARALRDAAPSGAVAVPADALATDLDVAGTYLDAKNRVTGLLGEAGPTGDYAVAARAAALAAREAVPGRRAPGADVDAGTAYGRRLRELLAAQTADVAGARALSDFAGSITPGGDGPTVIRLRTWLAVVEAMTAETPFGSVLEPAAASARAVGAAGVEQDGALADAVRVAAGSPETPATSEAVSSFARERSADVSAVASASVAPSANPTTILPAHASLPREVLARVTAGSASDGAAPAMVYGAGGQQRVAPPTWLAYRRADGAYFWLAGVSGPVALTDASVRGWAWSVPHAALVDARHVGRTLALFDIR